MPVLQVLFLLQSGMSLYSKRFSQNLPNEELISPFISAIISFAKHSFNRADLSNISIGNVLITIDSACFEGLDDIIGIMLSTGIDDSTAHAILLEIMEKFTIQLDEQINEGKIDVEKIQKGKYPDMNSFDKTILDIVSWEHDKEFINFDLSISLPKQIIDLINKLYSTNDNIADIYQHKESALIEQILLEYIYNDLENKIREKFSKKVE